MFGAIIGDITGSTREWNNIKTRTFPLLEAGSFFTDDTVMTCAVASSLLVWRALPAERQTEQSFKTELITEMQQAGRKYEGRGYGGSFAAWIYEKDPKPYGSWGNGSAMRVSAVGDLAKDLAECKHLAAWSAEVTHDHPEGVKGALATAVCVYLARHGSTADELRAVAATYYPQLSDPAFTVDAIRPDYDYDVSCMGTVPQAIQCALEAANFEDAIRNAISLGGDSDTLAAVTGGIAEAMFGIPTRIALEFYDLMRNDDDSGSLCSAILDAYREIG